MTERLTAPPPTSTTESHDAGPSPKRIKVMTVLVWLTTVAIALQAVTAGQFVSQGGKEAWVEMHGVIADVSWVLALASAGYAYFALRTYFPMLVRWSVVLFAATLAQTGIGHLITDLGMGWMVMVHIPMAFVVFGAAGYLSVWAIGVRHQAARGHLHRAVKGGVDPMADVHDVVRPADPPSDFPVRPRVGD